MDPMRCRKWGGAVAALAVVVSFGQASGSTVVHTLDAHFDQGVSFNVQHVTVPDQLQLHDPARPAPYLWAAASERGTMVRIDIDTGAVLGEYLTAPDGRGRNPSRTTVDRHGSCWVGNRDE